MVANVDCVSVSVLASSVAEWWDNAGAFIKVIIGFSIIIFVHELGHFLVAKWSKVRIDRFAVGFGPRLIGWRRGQGLTIGNPPELAPEELAKRDWGETDYCLRALPFGGYVKMLGQDDIVINDETDEVTLTNDPRSFVNRPVGQRMLIVSAGVIFNLLFAAILFMWMFLIGHEMLAPVVGDVVPLSPAANAGLMPGDRIVEVNGKPIESFFDYKYAVFVEDELHMKVERDGRMLPEEIVAKPEFQEDLGQPMLGVAPAQSTTLSADCPQYRDLPAPKAGDVITQVNGHDVHSATDIARTLAGGEGDMITFTVLRPAAKGSGGEPQTLTAYGMPMLAVHATNPKSSSLIDTWNATHILGFQPRLRVVRVIEGGAGDIGGMKFGDVVLAWDGVPNPSHSELVGVNEANPDKPVDVTVLRNGEGEPVKLTVTPQREFRWSGDGPVRVNVAFQFDIERPVVAQIVADTPAAAVGVPRGAEILAVDGVDVATWRDVIRVFETSAGRQVALRYRVAGVESLAQIDIPASITSELKLPSDAQILRINDKEYVTNDAGQKLSLPAPEALRVMLEQNVGKTVKVTWRHMSDVAATQEVEWTVSQGAADPWQMRLQYGYPLSAMLLKERVDAGGNPIRALGMGVMLAWQKVLFIYEGLHAILSMKVSASNISGPIGIVGVAMESAKVSFSELLFFLAFLSINLAVLNFLPLPVVDGGVMVFLLIEKIRGKALSIRTQMIATLTGLALILITFVLVTVNDIVKLISS